MGLLLATVFVANMGFAYASGNDANGVAENKKLAPTVSVSKQQKNIKPVDINSASKAELKKVPGFNDTQADRIIASRPHAGKADLVLKNIISREHYEKIKDRVAAKQTKKTIAQLVELQKNSK